jgi:hypothetical protein
MLTTESLPAVTESRLTRALYNTHAAPAELANDLLFLACDRSARWQWLPGWRVPIPGLGVS